MCHMLPETCFCAATFLTEETGCNVSKQRIRGKDTEFSQEPLSDKIKGAPAKLRVSRETGLPYFRSAGVA